MTPLEHLRLATALAHSVPGAELRLSTDRGDQVVVSHHPAADIDPCTLRQIVAASACPSQPDYSRRVVEVSIGGALISLGGGVHSTEREGRAQRWIASLLRPELIVELLDGVGLDVIPDDAMRAGVRPDCQLGVSLLEITANDPRFDHALDEIAAQAAAACFVEELRCSAFSESHEQERAGGTP